MRKTEIRSTNRGGFVGRDWGVLRRTKTSEGHECDGDEEIHEGVKKSRDKEDPIKSSVLSTAGQLHDGPQLVLLRSFQPRIGRLACSS